MILVLKTRKKNLTPSNRATAGRSKGGAQQRRCLGLWHRKKQNLRRGLCKKNAGGQKKKKKKRFAHRLHKAHHIQKKKKKKKTTGL